jgi:hypothetical protein
MKKDIEGTIFNIFYGIRRYNRLKDIFEGAMKMSEMLKKLEIVKEVNCYDWNTTQELIKLIKDDSTEILDITDYRDKFKQEYYPINKKRLIAEDNCGRGYNDLWMTFEKCRELEVKYYTDNFCECIVTIYDGDNFHGYRTNLRFILRLKIDIDFINLIEEEIDSAFDNYLDNEYEKHLERQKGIWIGKKRYNLLKDEE